MSVLAIDLGTSNIKAAVVRRDGSLAASSAGAGPHGRPLDRKTAKDRLLIAASGVAAPVSEEDVQRVRFSDELLEVTAPIRLDGEVVGRILLRIAELWRGTRGELLVDHASK